MSRETPFADIVKHLTPFFVSRQVFAGSGRVGIGQDGRDDGFQLSQRADYFEVEVGLETTLKRPIINTRDEPHADPSKYRRLHVIIGDANLSEISTYLKVGTTSLVLAMIEAGHLDGSLAVHRPGDRAARGLPRPVAQAPSWTSPTAAGSPPCSSRSTTASRPASSSRTASAPTRTPRPLDVLARWESVLDRLADDPRRCADELDWVAKQVLLEGFRDRDGLDWSAPKLQAVDLQYSDVRPEKGLYHRLVERRPDEAPARRRAHQARGDPRRRRTPARTSGASACAATPTRSSPRRGTRSSSTCPAATRCSACRRSSRCAARRPMSAGCSTAARTPRHSSMP